MRRLLVVFAGVLLCSGGANAQMMQAIVGGQIIPGITYSGPLDVVSGATLCYSMRACSAASAAATGALLNVKRDSDNATTDIHVLANGNLDTGAAATFAGTDATATCTVSGTTFTCSGASGTPHAFDPISGAGISQPCMASAVGTFTGGSGTVTASNPLTGASCGTVSSGVTMTFQVSLEPQIWYDRSGNANNFVLRFGSGGIRFLLNALGTSHNLPCVLFVPSADGFISGNVTWPGTTGTVSVVSIRYSNFTTTARMLSDATNNIGVYYANATNTVELGQGSAFVTATASDSVLHAMQFIFNGASSHVDVDGVVGSTGNPGTFAPGTNQMEQWDGTQPYCIPEMILWDSTVFSSGQSSSMRTSQQGYWNTP